MPDQPSQEELRAFFAEQYELIAAMADFRRVFHVYRNRVERSLGVKGLTHLQYAVLLALCVRLTGETYTVGELTSYFELTNPACVQLLNRMEGSGLIERVEDGNAARIVPTELGLRTIHSFFVFSELPPDPPQNLRAALVRSIVESSRLEREYFTARGFPYPEVTDPEDDG